MSNNITITRRMGTTPQQRGSATGQSCPDVFKLDDGYLVIGQAKWADTEMNKLLDAHGASVGTGEMAVLVPADCLEAAARDIARATAAESTT